MAENELGIDNRVVERRVSEMSEGIAGLDNIRLTLENNLEYHNRAEMPLSVDFIKSIQSVALRHVRSLRLAIEGLTPEISEEKFFQGDTIAGALAVQGLRDTLAAGGTVEIPSLGIKITEDHVTVEERS